MRSTSAAVLLALVACGTELPSGDSRDPVNTAPDAGVGSQSSDGGVTGAPGDGSTTPLTDCQEATQHSDLAWIQQKVFTPSCTDECHSTPDPSSGMDLTAGHAYTNLVNVNSNQFSGWKRVVPGDPRSSMLMVQIGGEQGPALEGTMPWGQPKLCDEKIDAIRRWIAAGAPQ
ncbi:MAG TPA: hypothetical protein VMZ53_06180 [Kofleriaceae bacterium]|nr:hypothetical protein [Kofleriaceae bacterium]